MTRGLSVLLRMTSPDRLTPATFPKSSSDDEEKFIVRTTATEDVEEAPKVEDRIVHIVLENYVCSPLGVAATLVACLALAMVGTWAWNNREQFS